MVDRHRADGSPFAIVEALVEREDYVDGSSYVGIT
jgi:hypothetical protein